MAEQELSAPGAVDVPDVVRSIVRRFAALPQRQLLARLTIYAWRTGWPWHRKNSLDYSRSIQ
jgi:hypothetical protein